LYLFTTGRSSRRDQKIDGEDGDKQTE